MASSDYKSSLGTSFLSLKERLLCWWDFKWRTLKLKLQSKQVLHFALFSILNSSLGLFKESAPFLSPVFCFKFSFHWERGHAVCSSFLSPNRLSGEARMVGSGWGYHEPGKVSVCWAAWFRKRLFLADCWQGGGSSPVNVKTCGCFLPRLYFWV